MIQDNIAGCNINIGDFLYNIAEGNTVNKEVIQFEVPSLKFHISEIDFQTASDWRKSHIHSAVEIVCVTEGEITAMIAEKTVAVRKGEMLLINSNVVHHLENAFKARITYMQIELSTNHAESACSEDMQLYRFAVRKKNLPYCIFHKEDAAGRVVQAMLHEMREKNPHYTMYVKSYMDWMEAFMLRHQIIAEFDAKEVEKLRNLLPVAAYIEENYANAVTLDTLANLIGYSKYELCHKFKSATGRTVVDYINHVRLCRAKILLENTDNSITEIALCCGFSSVQYFHKVFKKYQGSSPRAYRLEYRGKR